MILLLTILWTILFQKRLNTLSDDDFLSKDKLDGMGNAFVTVLIVNTWAM